MMRMSDTIDVSSFTKTPKLIEPAYAAGIFDADGCIGIYEAMKNNQHRRYMRIQVMVAGMHGGMLGQFKLRYGGSVCYQSELCKQWRQDSKEKVRIFLEEIRPFSIVKAKQIDVGLRFLSIPRSSREPNHRIEREELRALIKELKKEVVPYESEA